MKIYVNENYDETVKFYREYDAYNYSLLKYAFDPLKVVEYIQGKKLMSQSISIGNIIDRVMLSASGLDIFHKVEKYPTKQMLNVLRCIAEIDKVELEIKDIVDCARKFNFYNNLSGQSLYNKIMTETNVDIISALMAEKEIITVRDYENAERIVKEIILDKAVNEIYDGWELYAQVPLYMNLTEEHVNDKAHVCKLKGLADMIAINKEKKQLAIVDLKVTQNFKQYFKSYNLALQAGLYLFLLRNNKNQIKELLPEGDNPVDYKVVSFDYLVYLRNEDNTVGMPFVYTIDVDDEMLSLANLLYLDPHETGFHVGNPALEALYGAIKYTDTGTEFKIKGLLDRVKALNEMKEYEFKDTPFRYNKIILNR